MVVIWSGRGFLSVIVLFIALFSCISIFPESQSDLCFVIPAYITGIFSFFFGVKWNTTLRVFIDKETGKEINFKSNHSLFWIKMEYWGIIFTAFGLVILSQNLDKTGTEFYVNLFLFLFGILSIAFYGISLFKIKGSVPEGSQFKNTAPIEPKLNFIKEEIVNTKFDNEDHNQYLPK
jgi:di/tricarboxylate transporter